MKTRLLFNHLFYGILPSPFKRTDRDREEDLGCVDVMVLQRSSRPSSS